MIPTPPPLRTPLLVGWILACVTVAKACGGDGDASSDARWAGTVDTLASGRLVVSNPDQGLWTVEEAWHIEEDLRIGSVSDEGPATFGAVYGLDIDAYGRVWVVEGQAQEIRVFDADGAYVRTVGRRGGGPEEFAGLLHAAFGPDGHLWAMDPQNNRLSVIDTTGAVVASHRIAGGFAIFPWPGGWDGEGRYYTPIPSSGPGPFRMRLVRYDRMFQPLDTLDMLTDPVERDRFEANREGSRMMAGIPFTGGFRTARSPAGTLWGLFTDEYRLIEVASAGDTLRTVRVPYDPLPVTDEDRDQAVESLRWFTEQGGRIDPSKIPDRKPAATSLSVDEAGRVWIARVSDLPNGQRYDILDPAGRLLGSVTFPVPLSGAPVVRGERVYAVTTDELSVPYIVRFRIRPGASED